MQAETAILELERGEMEGRLISFDLALEVMTRGLGAMTSTAMGLTHLSVDDRESIINKLHEAGTSFVSQMQKEKPDETKTESKT